jgi:ergothioneine biosynthesis protein EgtB
MTRLGDAIPPSGGRKKSEMKAAATPMNNVDRILVRLAESRAVTDELFQIVRKESLYDRPIPERNRIVFYRGHLEAFDWNLIAGQAMELDSAHEKFDRLFAFGIDPVGSGLPTDQPSDWPGVAEIEAYNLRVRQELDRLLSHDSKGLGSRMKYPEEIILNAAIEHRLMHAETLAYMFHQLPTAKKIAPRGYRQQATTPPGPPIAARMVDIPEGSATLGIPQGNGFFGWDNEYKLHSVRVPAFAIDVYKVTNGDFLKFMVAGGYDDRSLWNEDDWAWIKEQNISHPRFWRQHQGQWIYRAMFEELPLPLDWPVYVSLAEASAYARFVGKSLPTEAQFHRAAYATPEGVERIYPWGDASPETKLGNFNFRLWDPIAEGSYPGGHSAYGVEDLIGNGWEWTSTPFAPFPGFEPFPFYRGYSANFFDGKHYVIKGASPRTAACMLRRSFRNWFQPHYPFLYASFRCVSN